MLTRPRDIPLWTHNRVADTGHVLYEFFAWCATYGHIPELVTLARTVDRWRQEIINAVLLGVSNARSEGLNRVLKLEGRKAYGFVTQSTSVGGCATPLPVLPADRHPPEITQGDQPTTRPRLTSKSS